MRGGGESCTRRPNFSGHTCKEAGAEAVARVSPVWPSAGPPRVVSAETLSHRATRSAHSVQDVLHCHCIPSSPPRGPHTTRIQRIGNLSQRACTRLPHRVAGIAKAGPEYDCSGSGEALQCEFWRCWRFAPGRRLRPEQGAIPLTMAYPAAERLRPRPMVASFLRRWHRARGKQFRTCQFGSFWSTRMNMQRHFGATMESWNSTWSRPTA
jgi:hypothetical protein